MTRRDGSPLLRFTEVGAVQTRGCDLHHRDSRKFDLRTSMEATEHLTKAQEQLSAISLALAARFGFYSCKRSRTNTMSQLWLARASRESLHRPFGVARCECEVDLDPRDEHRENLPLRASMRWDTGYRGLEDLFR
jgi:hypothetical protein